MTGGAGFVALHLAEQAVAAGHNVVLADPRDPPAGLAPLAAGAAFRRADILEISETDAAWAGFDAIVHLAAVVGPIAARARPERTTRVNVMGTSRMLELGRVTGARLVYLSTATLYGNRPDLAPLDETDPPDPVSLYDATKLMGETLVASYRATFGVTAASIRTGFVFGPGHSVGEYFVPAVLAGQSVSEAAGGGHPCDFTYVVDLARALLRAAEAPRLPEPVYNVSGGVLLTRADFADAVRAVLPQAQIDLAPGLDHARHLRGANRIDRARRDLGFTPTPLPAAIADWVARARRLEIAR